MPLLWPFWGGGEIGFEDASRYRAWTHSGSQHLELTDVEHADALVLPAEWRPGYAAAQEMDALAGRLHKPLLVFFNSDSTAAVSLRNATVFRTSALRSRRQPNEFGLPGWSVDFVEHYLGGKPILRSKGSRPVVAYTGYVDYRNAAESVHHGLRWLAHGGRISPGLALRGRVVRALQRDPRVETRVILRRDCLTGAVLRDERMDFVQNMVNADYALVARGGGNFSYRLYEALSCGRIPLFIDTDCLLPYDHLIDWRRHCVWVESRDLATLADRLVAFHDRLSPSDFTDLQQAARRLYLDWLSPAGFYQNLWRCLPAAGLPQSF